MKPYELVLETGKSSKGQIGSMEILDEAGARRRFGRAASHARRSIFAARDAISLRVHTARGIPVPIGQNRCTSGKYSIVPYFCYIFDTL